MAKKKRAAYRKKHQNKFSMFLVTIAVLMIMVVVAVDGVQLQRKIDEQTAKEQELLADIDAEEKRAEEIKEFGTYTQTKGYVEEVAKEKFRLVNKDEVVFVEED